MQEPTFAQFCAKVKLPGWRKHFPIFLYTCTYNTNVLEYAQNARNGSKSMNMYIAGHSTVQQM